MKPVPTLSSAFLQPSDRSLPGPLQQLREQRAAALAGMPLPTRKTENWKYSARHLKLDDSLAAPLPAAGAGADAVQDSFPGPGYRAVFRNGILQKEASTLPETDGIRITRFADLDEAEARELAARLDSTLDLPSVQLAQLNGARFDEGLYIRLAADTVLEQPLYLVHEISSTSSGSAFPRIFVDAGRHSRITLVEAFVSDNADNADVFLNTVSEFCLGEGAALTSIRLDLEAGNVRHIGATGVRQAAGSRFESHCVGFGGPLRRHDLQVSLDGRGAECSLNGVVVAQERQHFDNHTNIEHRVGDCNSEVTYRNIAADQSHVVFSGRIHIHQDAQKSNADMNNRNLLLSDGAEIDTKPELEIYADDVKCAHGATIGQLDETSVFYLVSRSIGRQEARTLLTMAFINELVAQIPVEAVREAAQARLTRFFGTVFREA